MTWLRRKLWWLWPIEESPLLPEPRQLTYVSGDYPFPIGTIVVTLPEESAWLGAFQAMVGITVDGKLGPQSWVALAEWNKENPS